MMEIIQRRTSAFRVYSQWRFPGMLIRRGAELIMNRKLIYIIVLIVLWNTRAIAAYQTWTDNQGRTIYAGLAEWHGVTGSKDDYVLLKFPNGEERHYLLRQFSESDQHHIRRIASEFKTLQPAASRSTGPVRAGRYVLPPPPPLDQTKPPSTLNARPSSADYDLPPPPIIRHNVTPLPDYSYDFDNDDIILLSIGAALLFIIGFGIWLILRPNKTTVQQTTSLSHDVGEDIITQQHEPKVRVRWGARISLYILLFVLCALLNLIFESIAGGMRLHIGIPFYALIRTIPTAVLLYGFFRINTKTRIKE